jgi:hypothetical protein
MTTSTLKIVVAGVCFVGLVLGVVCFGSMKERKTMALTKASSVRKAAIPPIDVSVPTQTETATFALG